MLSENKEMKVNILVPVLSVVLGLVLGAIIMVAFGFDPIAGYQAMLRGAFGSKFYIGETLRYASPLIVIGLGFSVANTAGFFNIGVAGQVLIGWLSSVWVAISFPEMPGFFLLPLSILAGVLAGAVWAGIAGVLRAYFNTSEVIVTIMLNYTALYTTNYLVRNVLTDSADTTPAIPEQASLRAGWLTAISGGSRLNMGIFISLVLIVVVMILMQKTTLGYEIRAGGLNKFASEYAGMNTKRNIILSMLISGALAGLGGVMEGLGTFGNIFVQGAMPALGFDGLAVALLGLSNPLGILFAALLFAVLKIGGTSMPLGSGVPTEVVDIVIASIIFFVGANYLIRFFIERRAQVNGKKGGVE
ncbi:MAG: ABC transporter permease [Pisciglobus halotolerans]|nr:ABC transporter permease [Pisciglobus halotolerans]